MANTQSTGTPKTTSQNGAKAPTEPTKPPATAKPAAPPAGYQKSENQVQVAGYWLPEKGPIHGKLVGAYDFRQKSGRGKGQLRRVYVLDLADPCVARVPVEDGKGKSVGWDEAELKSRELCGVFGSAGLKDLDTLGNCFVHVTRQAEKKELDSGNAMWLFDVFHKGTPKPLKVRQASSPEAEHTEGAAVGGSNEELPF